MKLKVYHNPRCSKSRCAIDLLNERGIQFEVVEYLKETPTVAELASIINKLGIKPEDLLRKGESDYKENFKGKELSDEQWIEAMIQFPKLIERPIVINDNRAIIGRPTERILEIL